MAKKNTDSNALYTEVSNTADFFDSDAESLVRALVPDASQKALREAVAERVDGIKADINWLADALEECPEDGAADPGPALRSKPKDKAAIVKVTSTKSKGRAGAKAPVKAKKPAVKAKAPAKAKASAKTTVPAP